MAYHILRLSPHISPSPPYESDLYHLPTLAQIHLRAWLTVPLYSLIYHGPPSTYPGILTWTTTRHRHSLLSDSTCTFLVLLYSPSPETGVPWQTIAFVKYNVYATQLSLDNRIDAGKREWPEGTNIALVEEFWGEIVKCRKRHGEVMGPHVSVDILATDPEYQRRGAGRMLMDEVVKEADEKGLPCVLEGSEAGMKLSQSVGFEEVDAIWVDLGRWVDGGDKGVGWRGDGVERMKGVGEGWYRQSIMERKARGKVSTET